MWYVHGTVSRSCAQLCKIFYFTFFFLALHVIVSEQLCYAASVVLNQWPRHGCAVILIFHVGFVVSFRKIYETHLIGGQSAACWNFFRISICQNWLTRLISKARFHQKMYKFLIIPLLGNKNKKKTGDRFLCRFHLMQMICAHAFRGAFPSRAAVDWCHLILGQMFV